MENEHTFSTRKIQYTNVGASILRGLIAVRVAKVKTSMMSMWCWSLTYIQPNGTKQSLINKHFSRLYNY